MSLSLTAIHPSASRRAVRASRGETDQEYDCLLDVDSGSAERCDANAEGSDDVCEDSYRGYGSIKI
jgi:hypothetical protein